jgi:hypothetical protein
VTAQDNSFDSGFIAKGGAWSFTAARAGTFAYYCVFHPGMQATLIVGATAPPTPTATAATPTGTPTGTPIPTAPTPTRTPSATAPPSTGTPQSTATPTIPPTPGPATTGTATPTPQPTGAPTPPPATTPTPTRSPQPTTTPTATPKPAQATKAEIALAGSSAYPTARGEAQYEGKGDKGRLEVELEGARAARGRTLDVLLGGTKLGSTTVSNDGEAEIKLSTEKGAAIPASVSGKTLEVRTSEGVLVVSGRFR